MTREEMDILAAEYVLGTLDAEARTLLRDRLEGDAALRQAVDAWEERLSGLDAEEAPLEPSAGLWDRIAPALGPAPSPAPAPKAKPDAALATESYVVVRKDEGDWKPHFKGIRKKSLYIAQDEGTETFLLRFEPGARLPRHHHGKTEECIMLEGEADVGDLHLTAGDFQALPAGTVHSEIISKTGCLVYVRGQLRAAAR